MSDHRETKILEEIAHVAADFLARESNRKSLITVTRAELSPDMKRAIIYISVMPREAEEQALNFTKRMRSDFRKYLYDHTRIGLRPTVDFLIDDGEKNRQRIDDLTRK
jgi:ribosome-binding factor A